MLKPPITIITVSFNAKSIIENTILSVINQTYKNIEYIIIDGDSTDGTLDVIKKYEKYVSYWISEPDKGIYDAMNKGIKAATGEWINFMNCGDSFAHNNVIEQIFNKHIDSNINVIYGDTLLSYKHKLLLRKTIPTYDNFPNICHQSAFARNICLKQYPFNLKYKIAADIDFFYKIFSSDSFIYIPILISKYDITDGLSANNPFLLRKEYAEIFNLPLNEKKINWGKLFSIIKKYIPQKIYESLYLFYLKRKKYILNYK